MIENTVEQKRPLQRQQFSSEAIEAHQAFLEEKIFFVRTRWPEFRRLLDDVRRLAAETPAGCRVISFERTILYGGISLFAPFFSRHDFLSLDCSPSSADERGAYNIMRTEDPRCIRVPCDRRASITDNGLTTAEADLVIVPNLVHHVQEQDELFSELARVLKPGGRGYIYEPLLRELHQWPDDYVRYTPSGFNHALAAAGLVMRGFEPVGGPFSAIAYCWVQALEYIPLAERGEIARWFNQTHFKQLQDWDPRYPVNLERRHTSFPTAFGIHFEKPTSG